MWKHCGVPSMDKMPRQLEMEAVAHFFVMDKHFFVSAMLVAYSECCRKETIITLTTYCIMEIYMRLNLNVAEKRPLYKKNYEILCYGNQLMRKTESPYLGRH